MIVLAIITTLAAIGMSFAILWANSMRSSPGEFQFGFFLAASWFAAVVMWFAWWFN